VPVPPFTPPSATEPAAVDRAVEPAAAPVPQAPMQGANVLPIPDPGVPAFLAVHAGDSPAGEIDRSPLALVPEPAFAWRSPAPVPDLDVPPRADVSAPEPGAGIEWPTIDFPSIPAPAVEPGSISVPTVAPAPAGYELPSPVLEDADLPDFSESGVGEALPPERPVPEAERPEAPSLQALAASSRAGDAEPGAPQHPSQALAEVPQALSLQQELREWRQRQDDDAPEGVEALPTSREAPAPDALDFAAHDEGSSEPAALARDVPPGDESAQAEPGAELLAGELSFVRAARRKAFWRKPAVRASLSLVGLLGALSLQVVVHERHYLAAVLPQARVHLESLCAVLECKVGPYRRIASVVVDGSSFQKIKGDEYQFSLTLRNHAETAVEMPAVELTLTDTLDQPVLRRVLRPEELAAPAELLAQAEWSTAVLVQIAPGSARITGYRVLAFYP